MKSVGEARRGETRLTWLSAQEGRIDVGPIRGNESRVSQSGLRGWRADGRHGRLHLTRDLVSGLALVQVRPCDLPVRLRYDPVAVRIGFLISGVLLAAVLAGLPSRSCVPELISRSSMRVKRRPGANGPDARRSAGSRRRSRRRPRR